jgi:hypothetical protein
MTADAAPAQPTDAATPKAPATKPAKKPVTKKQAPNPAAKKAAKPSKKPAAKDVNKSAEIRKVAAAMKAKGTKPRPSVMVAELGGRGIKVAAAQVSFVLKSMGFRPLRKRRKKGGEGAAAAGTPKAAARKAVGTGAVSIDDLLAAKKAVASLGGAERAVEAIQALKRLEG